MELSEFVKVVAPLSMTTEDRIISLYNTLEKVRFYELNGDIVECGVWKGGNILGCMEYCQFYNLNKKIWLYDTFSGMTTPKQIDVDYQGISAMSFIGDCYSTIEEVKQNLSQSSYPFEKLNFIQGDVCETLLNEKNIPEKISILRLDTDWYDSTKIELSVLFPKIVSGGYLIIDDYGHWLGCRKAVDEYFEEINEVRSFDRIGYTCVIYKKK